MQDRLNKIYYKYSNLILSCIIHLIIIFVGALLNILNQDNIFNINNTDSIKVSISIDNSVVNYKKNNSNNNKSSSIINNTSNDVVLSNNSLLQNNIEVDLSNESNSKYTDYTVKGNKKPLYPIIAKNNKWQGLVKLKVKIDANGNVVNIDIISTSGHEVLDNSAIKTIKNWKFNNPYNTYLYLTIPINYQLIN